MEQKKCGFQQASAYSGRQRDQRLSWVTRFVTPGTPWNPSWEVAWGGWEVSESGKGTQGHRQDGVTWDGVALTST